MLEDQHGRTANPVDLEETIGMARQTVEGTPKDHPDRAGKLNRLGALLGRRYERTGAMTDLNEAIDIAKQAVTATPEDHPDRAGRLNNLGVMLQSRYERTGNLVELEEGIALAEQAVAATPEDHADRAMWLSNLGNNLGRRYERTGAMTDLEEAINVLRQAVATTPDGHSNRAKLLSNLGVWLVSRYEQAGALADLEEAVDMAEQAVATTPEDNPDRAMKLSNLGSRLESRYERTGAMTYLERAVSVTQHAVAATPEDHPNCAIRLNSLGNKLGRRYERNGAMDDLEEAINVLRQAVAATPKDHPDRALRLSNLGAWLGSRYERTGAMTDLEEAIDVTREVLARTPEKHPNRGTYLNNLGNKLESRYERTGAMIDLEEAIVVAKQAVAATPEDQPNRAMWLSNLGYKLKSRYERTGASDDLDAASIHLQNAWNTTMASPFHRVKAAAQCIKLLVVQHNIDVAIQMGKDVIHLIPAVNTNDLDRNDQQYVVSTFAGVAADLCALLLASNKFDDALQYLEVGRAVILSKLIERRSYVSDLEQPGIARRYEELRDEVNAPLRGLEGAAREQALKKSQQSILDLNTCINEIRTIPGHERFLLSQTTADMQKCAAGGSIVIVNITKFRSDAIIITSAVVKAISLSAMSPSDAMAWLSKDWAGRRAERAEKNRDYLAYLTWLWECCVEQILDKVRDLQDPSGNNPLRVWWIGSGLASSMPFHAAGKHRAGSTETAYHRAVSSYAPSIKALTYARKRAKESETAHGSLVLISMPDNTG